MKTKGVKGWHNVGEGSPKEGEAYLVRFDFIPIEKDPVTYMTGLAVFKNGIFVPDVVMQDDSLQITEWFDGEEANGVSHPRGGTTIGH